METSQFIIQRLIDHIPFDPERRLLILEPSAGEGRLARAIRSTKNADVFCCELNMKNRLKLREDGFDVVAGDFFTYYTNQRYDYVVAVPPYRDNIDVAHIQHMLHCVKKGGKVITLTLPYWATGFHSMQRDFRMWLNNHKYTIEFIEDESYVACPKAILVIENEGR